MRKLMFLISPRDSSGNLKSSEQLAQEAAKAFQKYKKADSQVRFKMKLASILGIIQNNFLTKYLEKRKRKVWSERLAKQLGENLRRNVEAEKNDSNYTPPI